MRSTALILALGLTLAGPAGAGSDWPHWRGPNLDGRVITDTMPPSERLGLEVAWRTPLGLGYSGITVAAGKAITLYSEEGSDWAGAFDTASGKRIWRHRMGSMYAPHDGSDGGPLSTPLIHDGRVIVLSATGSLEALKLDDGSPIWRRSLPDEFGGKEPEYGFTTSPLASGNVVVVQTGGMENKAISGLDAATGKTLWTLGSEEVVYQSPAILDLAGRRQLVAASGRTLRGLDPATGKELWTLEMGEKDRLESATPGFGGKDRFTLLVSGKLTVFTVAREGEGFAVSEAFRSDELGGTYAAPLYHDGHFYGFKGQFLTCVNATDGAKVWKSRPPGGRGLILVNGQLVIFGAGGNVVVAAASPAGYKELARVQALEGSGYTWPSFADGKVFVRNLEAMAAVALVESRGPARRTQSGKDEGAGSGAFAAFLKGLENAPDKSAATDAFMKEQTSFPIIEGRRATFIYRGAAEDVAISGTMITSGRAEPMHRVEGTNLFHRTYTLEPGGRWEYQFDVDYGDRKADPLNENSVPGAFGGERSVVAMPGYARATHLGEPSGRRGKVETHTFKSEKLKDEREVTVYTPAGYESSTAAYPLLIVHQGKDWMEKGMMVNTLDNLVGGQVAPVVVAFVQPAQQWWTEGGGSNTGPYIDMLAGEFVPWMEGQYRLQKNRESRALMGTGYFGLTAAYAALKHPDVFGKVALQSVGLGLGSDAKLMALIESGQASKVQFYLDWNRYEPLSPDNNVDRRSDNRMLSQALKKNGASVAGGEVMDSEGWGSWRNRTDRILTTLFPGGSGQTARN